MYGFFKTVRTFKSIVWNVRKSRCVFDNCVSTIIVNVEKPNMVLCKSNFVGIYSISGEPIGRRFEITWVE